MSKRRKVASDYMSQGKNKLYIFGARENAEMAAFYFLRDRKDIELQGFVEDVPSAESLLDKPIFSKAAFLEEADPSRDAVFAPYVDGLARKQVFTDLKLAGYRFERYISPNASVWDANAIGENCFIQEHNNIQYGTYVGDGCSFWAGNHIGHHGSIAAFVTFTSHVVLSGRCSVGEGSYFGVNCTIRDGLTIGENVFIGQGANVTKDITESGVYVGAPARKIRDWRA